MRSLRQIAMNASASILMLTLIAVPPVHAWSIDWEIMNRFRAFDFVALKDKGDRADLTVKSKDLFETYAPHQGESLEDWFTRRVKETTDKNGAGISPYNKTNTGPWIEDHAGPHPHYDKQLVQLPQNVYLRVHLKATSAQDTIPAGSCDVLLASTVIGHGPCDAWIEIPEVPSIGGPISIESSGKRLHTQTIKPQLKVILGLGDSYGAGQGSPDQPTIWSSTLNSAHTWIPALKLFGPGKEEEIKYRWVKSGADWYSPRCDRSFFSAQSLVALRMAQKDPHTIVSFVHLACSGAEIIDGILAPQRLAPGMPENTRCINLAERNRDIEREVDIYCDVPQSQLAAAVETLCPGKVAALSQSKAEAIRSPMYRIVANKEQLQWIRKENLLVCESPDPLKIDLVLIQVGGNDIGFSGIIAWGLVPVESRYMLGNIVTNRARVKTGVICPTPFTEGCQNGQPAASERLKDLPLRYEALAYALENVLGVTGEKVVLPGYPNPLSDSKGKLCRNPDHSTLSNEWTTMRIKIPWLVIPGRWQFNLTAKNQDLKDPGEADVINWHVVRELNKTIKRATQGCLKQNPAEKCTPRNWKYVDLSSVMDYAGWCTDIQGDNNSRLLSPRELPLWNAYENHTRKIRTTNDAAMTQWPGPDTEKNNWISGTFHPNPWGHIETAKHILDALDLPPEN